MVIDTITLYVLVHTMDVIFLCLELSKKCADGLQSLHNKAKELTPLTQ